MPTDFSQEAIIARRFQEVVAGTSMLVFALSAMVLSGIGDALLGF